MKSFSKALISTFSIFILTLLFLPKPVSAFQCSVHGYDRIFLEWYLNIDTQTDANIQQGNQRGNDRFEDILFAQHRFRMEPVCKVNDWISFHATFDLLDNVLFGSNDIQSLTQFDPLAGTITLPGGAGAFGVTGGDAGDVVTGGEGAINVRRLYADIMTPIGKFRIGRQPSNWGLGILQHDGNGMFDKFGDTFDRFLYMAKYDFKDSSSLAFAFLTDFVFAAQEDPTISRLEGPVRPLEENTYQITGALVYQNPNHGFEIGTFSGVRLRDGSGEREGTALNADGEEVPGAIDGDTTLFYIDLYGKKTWSLDTASISLAAEYAFIGGTVGTGACIDAIQVPAGFTNPLPNPICLDGENDIRVHMGAVEVEGKHDFGGEWKFIAGAATGDEDPLSSRITQFGFRPDYLRSSFGNLMLFVTPMGTSPAIQVNGQTVLGNVPITDNRVNNAAYVGGKYLHNFDIKRVIPQSQHLKFGGYAFTAWALADVINIDFAEITGIPNLPKVKNDSRWYGIEAGLITQLKVFNHLTWDIRGGVFIPGPVFDIKNDDFENNTLSGNPINAIQADDAEPAYAIRSTLFIEY